ncbi:MAG TPA: hypothetical protein VK463_11220 [Desulfomonilaceae bacterium]|nr:hypothetical protein [Desulfomonilaceae bacterium]
MKRFVILASVILVAALSGLSWADDVSTDKYIKDLKDSNPEIRAKAAYELGCG